MSDNPTTESIQPAPDAPNPGTGTDSGTGPGTGQNPVQNPAQSNGTGAIMARLGPAAVLGVLWTVLPAVMGILLVVKFRAPVADWLQGQELAVGLAVYVGIFALSAGFGVLPTVVQALIGGYAFGLVWGIPGALAGFILASLIGYTISRLVARHKVEAEIERHPKALAVREALVGGGPLKTLGIVTLVRVPPNSPFALTNLVLTTVEVRLWIYAVGTAFGMTPRTVAVVWVGTQVSDWDNASKPGWLLYSGIGLTVVVLLVLGHLGNKAIERVTGGGNASGAAEQPNDPNN